MRGRVSQPLLGLADPRTIYLVVITASNDVACEGLRNGQRGRAGGHALHCRVVESAPVPTGLPVATKRHSSSDPAETMCVDAIADGDETPVNRPHLRFTVEHREPSIESCAVMGGAKRDHERVRA